MVTSNTSQQISFSHLKVLVVESNGNMRSTIVHMLRGLGVHTIKAVGINGQVFIEINRAAYDVVLVGHNDREGFSGLQLLETARQQNMINPSVVWLLMTSDPSQEAILHALDSQPDAVITKPFSAMTLKKRLEFWLSKKRMYKPVLDAIYAKDWEQALLICERDYYTDTSEFISLTRAQMLLHLNQSGEAEVLLKKAYEIKPDKAIVFAWAQMAIHNQQYEVARDLLVELVQRHPLMVTGYDLLADVYAHAGDLSGAIEALQDATARAPWGVPRHMKLGDIATKNKSYDLAGDAYKKSILLARNTCFSGPDAYLKLANVKRLQIPGSDEKDLLEKGIDKLLSNALRKFPRHDRLRVEAALLRAELCDDTARSQQLRMAAERFNGQLESPFDIQRLKLALLGDDVPMLGNGPVVEASQFGQDLNRSIKFNRQGAKHYVAGRVPQAMKHFSIAIECNGSNGFALLNLVQLFIESARDDSDHRQQRLVMAKRYLSRADDLDLDETAIVRSAQLRTYLTSGVSSVPAGSLGRLLV